MKKFQICVASAMFVLASSSNAETGVESLSTDLRTLLSKEMVELQRGMQAILPAYVSGDLEEVAAIAEKIENSFILKQQITETQKKELGAKLPEAFIRMDKQFHEYAGMLKHVAEMKRTELVGFYYSELTEACVACHMEFATHRFPRLDKPHEKNAHQH